MLYEAPDGTHMNSRPNVDVTYKCSAPSYWPKGIHYVYVTGEGENGVTLLTVKREVIESEATITLTEGTPEDLQNYLNSISL